MKSVFPLVLLIIISACGNRGASEKMVKGIAQPLKCVIPAGNVIKVAQSTVDKIMLDLQGRPFNRNSFWNIISRDSRLEINLALNDDLKVPEEVIYRGFVLFMENYVNNPGQNYYLKTSQHNLGFVVSEDASANEKTNCEDQDKTLAGIDISRLIPASSEEIGLSCTVNSLLSRNSFQLRLFKNHLILITGQEKVLFVGGEIIRQDELSEIKFTALDPKQRNLSMKLDKNEDSEMKRKVAIQFSGMTTSIDGSGDCVIQRM